MRILVLALSGIGDALMFTPALQLMKKHLPEAKIDALVMFRGVEDIFTRTGQFNNVIYFDFMKEGAFNSLKFITGMRNKYTHSISVYPANRKEYNIINFMLGAPVRGAVHYKRMNTRNLSFLNNVLVFENDARHNAEENLLLVRAMFGIEDKEQPPLKFNLNNDDISFAGAYLEKLNIPSGTKLIGIHAGCSTLKNHIMRRWEPEKFAGLARLLSTKSGRQILLFGGPEEAELNRSIATMAGTDGVHIVRTANLGQSAALIEKTDVFITNDSSLMHVSSAMQRKVVAVIGPTNTHYISPWKTGHTIVSLNLDCAPCFFYSPKPLSCSRNDVQFKCIRELDVEMVLRAAESYLA